MNIVSAARLLREQQICNLRNGAMQRVDSMAGAKGVAILGTAIADWGICFRLG